MALILHYRMDDVAATKIVLDATGNSNGTSIRNTDVITVGGKIIRAFDFDGTADYIDTSTDFQTTFRASFTIATWAKATTWPVSTEMLIGYDRAIGPGDHKVVFRTYDSGRISFSLECEADDISVFARSDTGFLANGLWYHFVGTADATTNLVKLYVNGILIATGDEFVGGMPSFDTESTTMFVGAAHGNTGDEHHFDGLIDDIRLYNTVLTLDEVKELYNPTVKTIGSRSKLAHQLARMEIVTPSVNTQDMKVMKNDLREIIE